MPFGPIKTTLAFVGASIVSYYTISPAAKAVFGNNDDKKKPLKDVKVTPVKAVKAVSGGGDPAVGPGENKDVEGVASGGGDGPAVDHGKNKNNEEASGDGNDDGAASGDGDGAANGGGGGKKQHFQRSALVRGDRGRLSMHRQAYTTTVSTQVRSRSSGDRGRLTRRQAASGDGRAEDNEQEESGAFVVTLDEFLSEPEQKNKKKKRKGKN
jgi:hypothetical protein